MKELTYGAFSAALHERQSGQRAPLQVSIEVTRRCPLECLLLQQSAHGRSGRPAPGIEQGRTFPRAR